MTCINSVGKSYLFDLVLIDVDGKIAKADQDDSHAEMRKPRGDPARSPWARSERCLSWVAECHVSDPKRLSLGLTGPNLLSQGIPDHPQQSDLKSCPGYICLSSRHHRNEVSLLDIVGARSLRMLELKSRIVFDVISVPRHAINLPLHDDAGPLDRSGRRETRGV